MIGLRGAPGGRVRDRANLVDACVSARSRWGSCGPFTSRATTVKPSHWAAATDLAAYRRRRWCTILQRMLEAFLDVGWRTRILCGGDVLDVTDGVRHGWRNISGVPASASIDN